MVLEDWLYLSCVLLMKPIAAHARRVPATKLTHNHTRSAAPHNRPCFCFLFLSCTVLTMWLSISSVKRGKMKLFSRCCKLENREARQVLGAANMPGRPRRRGARSHQEKLRASHRCKPDGLLESSCAYRVWSQDLICDLLPAPKCYLFCCCRNPTSLCGALGWQPGHRKKRRRREKRGCVGPQWAGATQAPQVSFSTSPMSAVYGQWK